LTVSHIRSAVAAPVADSAQPYLASFVTSAREIGQYEGFVRSLAAKPGMLSPSFFLASVLPHGWRPLMVVIWQGQRIAGLLYCKERVMAGIGIRMAFGNDDLGGMIVARPEERESVLVCGVTALLTHMLALRLVVSPAYLPILKDMRTEADFTFCRAKNHAHLDLPRTFEEFLGRLGARTRRNFRYYGRKSEQAGNEFVPCSRPRTSSRRLKPFCPKQLMPPPLQGRCNPAIRR
jgi:hypothetical protein